MDTTQRENLQQEASRNIVQRLGWETAVKDQAGIATELARGNDVVEVYGLGEAGLFDEFFCFLDQIGAMSLLPGLEPKHSRKRRSNVRFSAVILIYLMRIVAGLRFYWHTKPVLLMSQPLMRLVGFNGREVGYGTSNRGPKKKGAVIPTPDQEAAPREVRGPVGADSVATFITKITAGALERCFNRVIGLLAAASFFPKNVHALMDASVIESTESCKGRGMVTKEVPPSLRLRPGRIRKVKERIFGFKLWAVWNATSRLPLAIRFATVEVADINMAQELVQQAIDNLGSHARLASLAFDRGFLDGKFLWWLDQQGIVFQVPAKSNLDVYRDALDLVDSGIRQQRQRQRSIGRGRNRQLVVDQWEAVGLTGLTSAGFYGSKGSGSHQNRNDFRPNPINAVVVLDDPYRQNNPEAKIMVILTNGPVDKPLATYDAYDLRSEIENSLFREAKQAWFIERPAKNSDRAFRAHCYLTIMTMALTTAFHTWIVAQDKLRHQGVETGIRKFREQVTVENRDKVIVFNQGRYAIFDAYELVILLGRTVLMPRGVPETVTKEDILRKYGAALE